VNHVSLAEALAGSGAKPEKSATGEKQ